jgi:uncharacterized protein (DUF1778 family)
MANATARTEKLDLRVSSSAKLALREAARAARQSLSEFVLDSALTRAEQLLTEQTRVTLSPDQWTRFLAALDEPVDPSPRLSRLLSEPSVFER